MLTPTAKLADHLIDGGLEKYVRERRLAGKSWRLIALDLRKDTEIEVTPESVRAWFSDRDWAHGRRPGATRRRRSSGLGPGSKARHAS